MAWQAETGIRFPLIGGWGFVPGSDRTRDEVLSPLRSATLLREVTTQTSALSASQAARMRALLSRWAPIEVVLIDSVTPAAVARNLRGLLGRPASTADGAMTWIIS
jgi:hypothetical protein